MSRAKGILPLGEPITPRVLEEILGGGQTFLWGRETGSGGWLGIQEQRVFRVSVNGSGELEWNLTAGDPAGAGGTLRNLFALDTDFASLVDGLPWRSDPVLRSAMGGFPGLRILRQPVGLTLLCFLLSPLKRIDQIRAGLLALARKFGTPLGNDFHGPPTWTDLAEIPEAHLRSCGIGYRAKSIHLSARFLARNPGFLECLCERDTAEARDRLLELPGVGRKIADCVLLFGLARLEAFPIDTWISREMRRSYGLEGYSDLQLQQFAAAHFGEAAGLAQQFLFAAARGR